MWLSLLRLCLLGPDLLWLGRLQFSLLWLSRLWFDLLRPDVP